MRELAAAVVVAGAHDHHVVADRQVELDRVRACGMPCGELLAVTGDADAVEVGKLHDAHARRPAVVRRGRGVRAEQQLAAIDVVARDGEPNRWVVDALDGGRGELREVRVV